MATWIRCKHKYVVVAPHSLLYVELERHKSPMTIQIRMCDFGRDDFLLLGPIPSENLKMLGNIDTIYPAAITLIMHIIVPWIVNMMINNLIVSTDESVDTMDLTRLRRRRDCHGSV